MNLAYQIQPGLCRGRQPGSASPDHRHVPFGVWLPKSDVMQPPQLMLGGDHPGQKSDAHSRAHKLHHEICLSAPGHHVGVEPRPFAGVQNHPMQRKARVEQDEGCFLQVQHRDGSTPLQRMPRRQKGNKTIGSRRTGWNSNSSETGRSAPAKSISPARNTDPS